MRKRFLEYYFVLLMLCCDLSAFSQTDEQKWIREGNQKYKENKFTEAERNYMEALGKNQNSFIGSFNLGNAYYKQGKYKEAAEQFGMLSQRELNNANNATLSKLYHNLGNAYLKQKEYEKSINAYKNALRRNDSDEETRYNLSYAQKMLKQQQEQQKKNQQKQNEENKEDKKNQEQKNQQKNEQNKNEQKKQNEQQHQNISKEDAERLLEAMNNDERKLRDKMNEKKIKPVNIQIEKDW